MSLKRFVASLVTVWVPVCLLLLGPAFLGSHDARAQCRSVGGPGEQPLRPVGSDRPLRTRSVAPLLSQPSQWGGLFQWDRHPPLGFATEDWHWEYATGRAVLSTVVPITVGGVLLRIRPRDRTLNGVELATVGAGLLAGPSMGQWCLGGRYARKSVLPTLLRGAGVGGTVLIWRWLEGTMDDAGLGAITLVIPAGLGLFFAGSAVIGAASLSFQRTPRVSCEPPEGTAAVSVAPAVGPRGRSVGVGLSVRL